MSESKRIVERSQNCDDESPRILEEIPETKSASSRVTKAHAGPMPSPEDLALYARVADDLPSRMMAMAEKSQKIQAEHNAQILALKGKELDLQKLEIERVAKAADTAARSHQNTLNFSFILFMGCIVASTFLGFYDKTEVALALGGTTILGLAAALFNKGKKAVSEVKKDE